MREEVLHIFKLATNKKPRHDPPCVAQVFEKKKKESNGFLVSQSGDATCDGLFSASEGSRTLKLTKASKPVAHCHFPVWLTAPRHWRALNHRLAYRFQVAASYSVLGAASNTLQATVTCLREEGRGGDDPLWRQFVVHVTRGWVCDVTVTRQQQRLPVHEDLPALQLRRGAPVRFVGIPCRLTHTGETCAGKAQIARSRLLTNGSRWKFAPSPGAGIYHVAFVASPAWSTFFDPGFTSRGHSFRHRSSPWEVHIYVELCRLTHCVPNLLYGARSYILPQVTLEADFELCCERRSLGVTAVRRLPTFQL
ncbi:hypothetical protein LAZ67_6003416 [Cordylochernes scorpioides]|uniref:Uncharacterized protein n=1 Tax=Cordylochernes scorpioides TaxID=51811 RepID=A0ABY6KQL3_9ARAC|nr:hypothetical protein LAZ67_6003416 [Cordylochernes scorpioides]